jgi:hypothetical protein
VIDAVTAPKRRTSSVTAMTDDDEAGMVQESLIAR